MRLYGDVQIKYFVVHIRVYQTLFAFKFIYLDCICIFVYIDPYLLNHLCSFLFQIVINKLTLTIVIRNLTFKQGIFIYRLSVIRLTKDDMLHA